MRFEFATAGRIVFGPGTVREVAPAAREMGRRALLVTGRSTERATAFAAQLEAVGVTSLRVAVPCEPTVDMVRHGVIRAREENCDLVIAFGGGSALDAGKAMAALMTNTGDLMEYLEVVGKGRGLATDPAPFIAVPTTAGTGTEVTRNAVLASTKHQVKVSLRSPLMLPRLAVVDPELTLDLPPDVTARTGLDALTQLVEPFVSSRANPVVDGFCREGLRCVSRSLRRAYHQGREPEAREDMSLAALLAGLALANAGLGVVHGIAGPFGGMFPGPHGAVCAALLPSGMAVNVRALRARAAGSDSLRRYEEIARVLTGHASATAEDGVEWVSDLCQELGIPSLRAYGVREQDVPVLVGKAAQASSMKANPIALTQQEVQEVVARAL